MTRIANRGSSAGRPSLPPAAARRGICRKRSRGSDAYATRRSSWRPLLRTRPRVQSVFDRPDEGIGYRIGKVQKRAFGEIKVLRAKGLERRADNLPPADQRRMASVFSANDRFAHLFGEGHSRTTNSKPRRKCASEFSSPASCPPPTYHSSQIMPLRSKSSSALSTTSPINLWGQRVEARRQTTARS